MGDNYYPEEEAAKQPSYINQVRTQTFQVQGVLKAAIRRTT